MLTKEIANKWRITWYVGATFSANIHVDKPDWNLIIDSGKIKSAVQYYRHFVIYIVANILILNESTSFPSILRAVNGA
jgi:hypothetical protein